VSGKDTVARDKLYQDAYSLIARSNLTRQVASAHVVALEDAVRRIEEDIAAAEAQDEANSAEAVGRVLSAAETGGAWLSVPACSLLSSLCRRCLRICRDRGTHAVAGSVVASSRQPQRGQDDVVMADLKPGVGWRLL